MKRLLLAATSAVALVAATGFALAQQQDKGGGQDKGGPAAQQKSPGAGSQGPGAQGAGPSQGSGPQNRAAGQSGEAKDKAGGNTTQRSEPSPKADGKSSAQGPDRSKDPSTDRSSDRAAGQGKAQGKAAERAEPKGKSAGQGSGQTEGRADSRAGTKSPTKAERDQGTKGASDGGEGKDRQKGAAQRNEDKDKASRKGTAERQDDTRDRKGQATKGAGEGTEGSSKGAADTRQQRDRSAADAKQGDNRARPQVAEEQRSQVGTTLLRESRVNRVTNVNVSVRVGERLPRSVRLAALPAAVISIAPVYSSYQYFVVDDRICIVDPATYVIVDVIEGPRARTAGSGGGRTAAQLSLSGDERAFLAREIEPQGRATLGLGVLTIGAEVPRNIELMHFPNRVVTEIPQLGGFDYVVVEERIAIVEPADRRVVLVIER